MNLKKKPQFPDGKKLKRQSANENGKNDMAQRANIQLCYGKCGLTLPIDPGAATWQIIKPGEAVAAGVGRSVFFESMDNPIGSPPLNELVRRDDRVVIVTSDGTRPVPNHLLIPWLVDALPVPPDRITVLLGNGGHRPNTDAELRVMFGNDTATSIDICNHDAFDRAGLVDLGKSESGIPCLLNRVYAEADVRIAVGMIEPHFFAGYSGGEKAIVPGVAGIDTILDIHNAALIGDAKSTWGTLHDNPIRQKIHELVSMRPPQFLVNFVPDPAGNMAALFAGDPVLAHEQGCRFCREHSFVAVDDRYDLVITTNCGYPLDQNIYQAVKGLSAAANIVRPGGSILLASECSDGVASHTHFRDIMKTGDSAEDVLRWIYAQPRTAVDQWQAQVLAQVLQKAQVAAFTSADDDLVRDLRMEPVHELAAYLDEFIATFSGKPRIAVLPFGFQAVPVSG